MDRLTVPVSTALTTASSGITIMGLNENQSEMIVLGIVGMVLGLFAFLFEHAHSEDRFKKTKLTIATEAVKYVTFGGLVMPSAVAQASRIPYISDYPTKILIGGIASWMAVELISVLYKLGVSKLGGAK